MFSNRSRRVLLLLLPLDGVEEAGVEEKEDEDEAFMLMA